MDKYSRGHGGHREEQSRERALQYRGAGQSTILNKIFRSIIFLKLPNLSLVMIKGFLCLVSAATLEPE